MNLILEKSFENSDLVLKKYFVLLSMLKTVVMLSIFVESMMHVFGDTLMNRKFEKTAFI